jgi:hypothetical protein
MTKPQNLQLIDIAKIDCLEGYIWHLGIMCISISTLIELQTKAESIGIFDTDEEEASKSLRHQSERLFTCAEDLLRMVISRSGEDWNDLKKKILDKTKHLTKGKKK